MRAIVFVFLSATMSYGQALVEHAAAAAGGTAGGVAGKKVSDGIDKVFRKVDEKAQKAAEQKNAPLIKVGPAQVVSRSDAPKTVAPAGRASVSGPGRRAGVRNATLPEFPAPLPVVQTASVEPPPPVRPAPVVTADDLKSVEVGAKREALLAKLGPPASRITMFDDGKVVEIYRYMAGDSTVGAVRLTDGEVSSVIVNRP